MNDLGGHAEQQVHVAKKAIRSQWVSFAFFVALLGVAACMGWYSDRTASDSRTLGRLAVIPLVGAAFAWLRIVWSHLRFQDELEAYFSSAKGRGFDYRTTCYFVVGFSAAAVLGIAIWLIG